ncbi:hypothetical protein G9A89_018493 [Geosiphon pyriformis]|nr:hypothetical protein G9A89_018493 [Geosiphon pyriformis]
MPEIKLTVKCSNDTKYTVSIDSTKTVLEFKQAIAEKSNTPVERQRLIYSGRVLKDNDTLETYKISEGHTVHMVKGASPGGGYIGERATGGAQTRSSTTPLTGQTTAQPPPVNPFAPGATFGGLPGLGIPAAGGFYGATTYGGGTGGAAGGQNPMEAFLQNPLMLQSMNQMLRDPQFLESMIALNPQLSAMAPQIRQYMQNPEFVAMLTNPENIRQMQNLSASWPALGSTGFGPLGGGGINPTTTPTANNTGINESSAPTTNPIQTTTTTTTSTPNSTTTTTPTTTGTGAIPPINPFLGLLNPNAATAGTNTPTPPAGSNPLLDQLLWGMTGGYPGAVPQTPAPPTQPPEERFQLQLQQLNEMGFWDAQQNIRALLLSGGNVPAAVEHLLNGNI